MKIPVIAGGGVLGDLLRLARLGVAVAGTHGKTTTTSLVGLIMEEAGLDPTVAIGGNLRARGTNVRLGRGDFMVAEADESDSSFLLLLPTVAVVTNIDPEHLDHYGTMDRVRDAYLNFINRVPFYGVANAVHRAVMVEVFRVDIGHDSHGGKQQQEGGIAFVGLGHHEVAATEAHIGAACPQVSADRDGRVETRLLHDETDERGRRRFAVRAADRDSESAR